MYRIFTIILSVVAVAASFGILANAQPPATATPLTSTVTPQLPHSLFARDTCSPPCWFGLTPGESTAEDAITSQDIRSIVFAGLLPEDIPLFQPSDESIVDKRTGYLIDGYYDFGWGIFWQRKDAIEYGGDNRIYVKDGQITSIFLTMNVFVTLSDTIKVLGVPDHIYFCGSPSPCLDLVYLDILTRITLASSRTDANYRPNICEEESIGDAFWVDTVQYFAPSNDTDSYPDNLVSTELDVNEIPLEIWEKWVQGGWAISCNEAYRQTDNLPVLPTVTPAASGST